MSERLNFETVQQFNVWSKDADPPDSGGSAGSFTYLNVITGATTTSAAHFGEAANEGLYLTSIVDDQASISAGAEYVGGNWTARSTQASILNMDAGEFIVYGDTGLTDGNTFTPTQLLKIEADGDVIVNDGAAVGTAANVRTVYDSAAGNIDLTLGDAAGADEVRVVDSGGTEVATVDSDGNGYFASKVGIGTASPNGTLHVHTASAGSVTANADSDDITIEGSGRAGMSILTPLSQSGSIYFGNQSDNNEGKIIYAHGVTANTGSMAFHTSSHAASLFLDKGGNVGIGATTPPTANGGKILFFGDNTADPTTASNTCGFYGKDVSGTVEAFAVDEAGNAAQLTPHNYSGPVQPIAGVLHWSQYHRNEYAGVEKWYDMERALKALETLTGEKFIHTQGITKKDWHMNQAAQGTRKAKPQQLKEF